jgi:hypothetical protein
MSRGFRFVGIVASKRRQPFMPKAILSQPDVTTYSNQLTESSVRRNITWNIDVDSGFDWGSGAQLVVQLFYPSSSVTVPVSTQTQNITSASFSRTGTFLGSGIASLQPNRLFYVKATLTDKNGQSYGPIQSDDITTSNFSYVNVSYSSSDSSTFYNTGWRNPNTSAVTIKTSGTINGAATNAVDGNVNTAWTVSPVTAGEYVALKGGSPLTEIQVATALGLSRVAADAQAVGVVANTSNYRVSGVQFRTEINVPTWVAIYDVNAANYVRNTSLSSDGAFSNINLNAYDNKAYCWSSSSVANNNSWIDTDISSTVSVALQTGLGGTSPNQYNSCNSELHILQRRSTANFQSWITDMQLEYQVRFTRRKVR